MSIPAEILEAVHLGRCPFDKLPPLMKKVVRIFISSTFSDTKEERNALMRHIYPKLAEFCREKYGLEFQVVDMRLGVPEQASDNHSTTDLCLQEIRKCQEVSVGPSFVVGLGACCQAILGDKYGYRPIPSVIEERLFQALKAAASTGVASSKPIDWPLVEEWYLKDENATPAVYVLQAISSKITHYNDMEKPELRKEAHNVWNTTNATLCATLRATAARALQNGHLTEEEKQAFFMSVTESEVTEGVFRGRTNPKETCVCIIRKIPDIDDHIAEVKARRFIDVQESEPQLDQEAQGLLHRFRDDHVAKELPQSNLSMMDIKWESSGAQISLETIEDLSVAKFAEKFAGHELHVSKHKEYLDNVCSDFFEKITTMIRQGGVKQSETYDDVTTEILQHLHFAKVRCEVFEGRDDVIDEVKTYLEGDSHIPLAIYGNSGCGKTSVMSKILNNLDKWCTAEGGLGNCTVIVRFLGTTALTSNLHQLLVSVCRQLCKVYQHTWRDPDKFSDLVNQFHELCGLASKEKPLIVLLDSIDQLMPAYNAYKLKWLPACLPPHVKMVVSGIDEGYDIVSVLQEKYSDSGGSLLQIKPLGENVGFQIVQKWLNGVNRGMTKQQESVLRSALEKCSLPLYARIAFDEIRRWRSYEEVSTDKLQTSIKGAINKLFQQMEQKFGQALVRHCLAYVTASRYGLSEVELEHVLSLDDELLNKVYQYWRPPVRRIPPLLWTRVRSEINNYIVERSADGILVLAWYHRQFIETTRQRYLSDKDFAQSIHQTLTEFFLGKWGDGKEKPFKYSQHQKDRFRLDNRSSQADRKLPGQPFIFESKTGDTTELRYNNRKLTELPYQLHKARELQLLRSQVFFNLEWLYAKLKSGSSQSILEEFELFMQADRSLRTDIYVRTLYSTFKLLRPYLSRYPETLPLELSGRLSRFVGRSPDMTNLVRQCDSFGAKLCPLTPLLTCFETADLGLNQIVNIRPTEPWSNMGTMSFTRDFRTMYIIDYDEHGNVYMSSWDVEIGEKIQEMPIQKKKEEYITDLYFHSFMDNTSTHLIALYKNKFMQSYGSEGAAESSQGQYRNQGCIDVIKVEDGVVVRSYMAPLEKRGEYFNPVIFLTDNWLAARFGFKIPMIHLYEDLSHGSSKPHLLLPDEKNHVIIQGRKSRVRDYITVTEEDSSKVVSIRSTSVHLVKFPSDEQGELGELDLSENTDAIACTSDGIRLILAAGEYGTINVYKLKKSHALGKGRKPRIILGLPRNERVKIAQRKNPEDDEGQGRQSIIVSLTVSPNDEFVIACYQDKNRWEAFFWKIAWTGNRYMGRVTENQPLVGRYPAFSADSQYIVFVCANSRTKVHVMSTANAVLVNEFDMPGIVRDIAVSKTTNQCAVMLGKDVVFMDIAERKMQRDAIQSKKRDQKKNGSTTTGNQQCILPREHCVTQNPLPEVQMFESKDQVTVREVQQLHATDIDRVSSAQTRGTMAIDSVNTPDGRRIIQLHNHVQVTDSSQEEIKYTPKDGDILIKVSTDPTSMKTTTENIPIGPSDGVSSVELLPGNRVVNANDKIRYRAPMETLPGTLLLSVLPSCVTVWEQRGEKLERFSRFFVHQERIVTTSDQLIVTSSKKTSGAFVNIYDMESSKLLTTHAIQGTLSCARLSMDSKRLYVVTTTLSLKVYEGDNFVGHETKIDLQSDVGRCNVKDIILFQGNPSCVLIQHCPEGVDGFGMSIYTMVNTDTKQVSQPMTIRPAFEDISQDGTYGIDSQLAVYNLTNGCVTRQIPYDHSNVNMQLQVRLSQDNKYVVFIDKQDDTLHVVRMGDNTTDFITSCFTHAPTLSAINGFSLRHSGRILSIRGPKLTLLLLRDCGDTDNDIDYTSEAHRALSLLPLPQKSDISDPASSSFVTLTANKNNKVFAASLGRPTTPLAPIPSKS